MLYTCSSCGASMVYDPDRQTLVCPQCGHTQCNMPESSQSDGKTCPVCGAPAGKEAETSLVYQCPYCKSWMTIDPNLRSDQAPKKITPFTFGKKKAREKILEAFDNIPFMPDQFLAEEDGEDIEALYAPFWLYDVKARGDYEYDTESTRSFDSGNSTITDHDVYHVVRGVDAEFSHVPVDAMNSLEDKTIDAAITTAQSDVHDFDPVFLAGTSAFLPDHPADDEKFCGRARAWASYSMDFKEEGLTRGYSLVKRKSKDVHIDVDPGNTEGVLYPVYRYVFHGFGTHKIYMDGATGRMSGDAPCDKGKVLFHYLTEAACVIISAVAVIGIVGVML